MAIRNGELHVIESFTQFKDSLNVDQKEIIESLNEKQKEQLVEIENEAREDQGKPLISRDALGFVGEVHRDSLNHLTNQIMGTNKTIRTVLEARDSEYTHVFEPPVHRIIELHPE